MKYASVCSGIEAASVAWAPLGWKPVWFSEIEKFPSKVLKHHYPGVPNLGDMTKLKNSEEYQKSNFDVLVGGTPCQSFSIAGLRGGLKDDRGNLALEFCRILTDKQPAWFIWENVPGVFSSFSDDPATEVHAETGREDGYDVTASADFANLLSAFSECGYSCSWAVLDSQYFHVPQRRQRVFVVGHLGDDWRPPFTVLFEPEGVFGNIEKGRKKGKEVTGTFDASTKGGGFPGSKGHVIAETLSTRPYSDNGDCENLTLSWNHWPANTASTLNAQFGTKQGLEDQHINSGAPLFVPFLYSLMPQNSGKDFKAREVDVTQPVMTNQGGGNQGGDIVCYPINEQVAFRPHKNDSTGFGIGHENDPAFTLQANHPHAVGYRLTARRLTPLECERLQGFPDNYTNIPGASDTVRYHAIGNSMTTHVMKWIGSRINHFKN